MKKNTSIFAKRLREARIRARLTQEELAVRAGIDEFSASARISQYESGKHVPRYEIAQRLAAVLKVPVEYLYATDDESARLLLFWGKLSRTEQKKVLNQLKKMDEDDDGILGD